jgi:hypothetical protein
LAASTQQNPLLVPLSDSWSLERIDLLVVAPDTDPHTAQRALEVASATDSVEAPEQILELAANQRAD